MATSTLLLINLPISRASKQPHSGGAQPDKFTRLPPHGKLVRMDSKSKTLSGKPTVERALCPKETETKVAYLAKTSCWVFAAFSTSYSSTLVHLKGAVLLKRDFCDIPLTLEGS
eukprot:6481954-Amphidinium_carterae.1